MKASKKFSQLYVKHYKKIILIPAIIFIFSLFVLYGVTKSQGVPIYRDISLKGGLSAIVNTDEILDLAQFEEEFRERFPENDIELSKISQKGEEKAINIKTDLPEEELILYLREQLTHFNEEGGYSSNFISPTLSQSFFIEAIKVMIISFVLMSVVIFIYFRKIVPSTAVVLSALFDIVVTLGVLGLLQFELSIAGIGALLMVMGYSIDTDVVLTNRLVKEKGENYVEKMKQAFKTGELMTLTTLIAGVVAIILTSSSVIFEIALILVIGLIVDFISTWGTNASLLFWWVNKEEEK